MANHKSAKKRARQDEKRRTRNRENRTRVKGAIKNARQALASGDTEATQAAVRNAESELRRASSKGAIPRKRVSRTISRLARQAN